MSITIPPKNLEHLQDTSRPSIILIVASSLIILSSTESMIGPFNSVVVLSSSGVPILLQQLTVQLSLSFLIGLLIWTNFHILYRFKIQTDYWIQTSFQFGIILISKTCPISIIFDKNKNIEKFNLLVQYLFPFQPFHRILLILISIWLIGDPPLCAKTLNFIKWQTTKMCAIPDKIYWWSISCSKP